MNCVCGCPVTDHAKVYEPRPPLPEWDPFKGPTLEQYTGSLERMLQRYRGDPGTTFTLSGHCLKCKGACMEFRVETQERVAYRVRLGQVRKYSGPKPSEAEWWKKYDRPQSAGRPEVM